MSDEHAAAAKPQAAIQAHGLGGGTRQNCSCAFDPCSSIMAKSGWDGCRAKGGPPPTRRNGGLKRDTFQQPAGFGGVKLQT